MGRGEKRRRWREHNRRCYTVSPADSLDITVRRGDSGAWSLSVGGMVKFGPEPLIEVSIAHAKHEALERVDRVLLDLRVAIGDVAR